MGVGEIDSIEGQTARGDADENSRANEDLDCGEMAATFRPLRNPKLPLFMEDAENCRPSETTMPRGRTLDDLSAFGAAPAKAEAMRMIVAASAEKRKRRAGSAATRSIANTRSRSDLGRKYLCVTASFRPARIGIWAIDYPALMSRRRSVKKTADL